MDINKKKQIRKSRCLGFNQVSKSDYSQWITHSLPINKPGLLQPVELLTMAFPMALPDWSNLAVLHTNALPARAHFYSYASEAAALTHDRYQSEYQSLNGTWKFHYAASPFGMLLTLSFWDTSERQLPSTRLTYHHRGRPLRTSHHGIMGRHRSTRYVAAPGVRPSALHQHQVPLPRHAAQRLVHQPDRLLLSRV